VWTVVIVPVAMCVVAMAMSAKAEPVEDCLQHNDTHKYLVIDLKSSIG
jgi:hypothetical protein